MRRIVSWTKQIPPSHSGGVPIRSAAFFLASIPQFVDPTADVGAQFVLGLISVTLNTSVDLILTHWAAKARAGLAKRPLFITRTRQASGAVMCGSTDLPDGSSPQNPVKPSGEKYFCFTEHGIAAIIHPSRLGMRGVSRSSRHAKRDAVDVLATRAIHRADERR